MKIRAILAVTTLGVIGKDQDLFLDLLEDKKFFRATTTGSVVLMGRKTYQSLPEKNRPLKNRINVVVSRSSNGGVAAQIYNLPSGEGTFIRNIEAKNLLSLLSELNTTFNNFNSKERQFVPEEHCPENLEDLYIIGGGEIYTQFFELGVVEECFVTVIQDVKHDPDTDESLTAIDPVLFNCNFSHDKTLKEGETDGVKWKICSYKNRAPKGSIKEVFLHSVKGRVNVTLEDKEYTDYFDALSELQTVPKRFDKIIGLQGEETLSVQIDKFFKVPVIKPDTSQKHII